MGTYRKSFWRGISGVAVLGAALTLGVVGTAGAQAPVPPKPLKTALIVVRFQDSPADISGQVEEGLKTLHDGEKSVSAFFDYFSAGKMQIVGRDGRRAEVYGPVTIPFNNIGCSSGPWAEAARAAATKAGANLAGYDRIIYALPPVKTCSWAGLGGGQNVWQNGNLGFGVLAHEFGHTLDWPHAGRYVCTSGGARVTLAATEGECVAADDGDPWDLMGTGQSRTPNSFHLLKAHFLSLDQRQMVTQSGEYTIKPLQPVGSPGVKMLRIPRTKNSTLDLEFRQPDSKWDNFAADDPIVNGVVVRRSILDGHSAAGHAGGKTFLVDSNPATELFNDAPVVPGRTIVDPLSGISITVKSIGPDGAVVDISVPNPLDYHQPSAPGNVQGRSGYSTSPTSPNVPVSLSWGPATDNVGVDHYEVYRSGKLVGSPTGTSFVDTTAERGVWAFYDVFAVDKAGNRGPKAALTLLPQEDPYAPRMKIDLAPDGTKVTLNAEVYSPIQYLTTKFVRDGIERWNQREKHYTDIGLQPGKRYVYEINARNIYGGYGAITTCEVTTPQNGSGGSSSCTGSPLTPATRDARSDKGPMKLKPPERGGTSHAYEGNQEGAPSFFVHGKHITNWAWPNFCPGDNVPNSILEALPSHKHPKHSQPIKIRRDGSFEWHHRAMQTFAPPEDAPEGTPSREHKTSVLFEGQFHHSWKEGTVTVTDFHPGCEALEPDMAVPSPISATYKVHRVKNPTVSGTERVNHPPAP